MVSKRDKAVRLREAGITYAEIGRRLGISRQWAWAILKWKPRPAKPELESKVMLTTGEAGQLLGLHVNTVRRWGRQGILKSYRIGPRGDRRFKREDIDGFLKEREMRSIDKTELPEFRDYARSKYPDLDEDIITMIEDILEHPQGKRQS